MFIPIIYNAALLTLLVLVLDIFLGERLTLFSKNRTVTGLMLGSIGIAVMLNPWQAAVGIFFDTRSVLLSLGGLFFGMVPALIAAAMTSAYRVYQGGAGVYMGVGVILMSALVGVIWRKRHRGIVRDISALELLTFGLIVHSMMMLLTLTLPRDVSTEVVSAIAFPVLTVYPMVTLALGFLLIRSQRRSDLNNSLRESEEKYRLLADNTLDVIWIMSLEARFLYLNPAVEKLLGYSPEKMIGKGLWEFCDEENFRFMRDRIEDAVIRLPDLRESLFEAVMLRKDGREVIVEITGRVVAGEDGEPVSLQGVTRDITERKRSEAEKDLLRLAIEHSVEAIMITDTEGTIVYVNPAFEKTSGFSRDEAVGSSTSILESGYHPGDFFEKMWETIRGGNTWQGRFVNRKKDGSYYTEESSIAPVFDENGCIIYFVAAKRDVTYETELEQQLLQSQKMEAVGQLAGGIAHDFNNILHAMMGYCEMLGASIDEESEQYEFVMELQKGTERAADLTRKLLTFSRRQVIELRNVDLNEIIRDMLKLIGRTIGEQIELRASLREGHLFIHADTGQIEQVLMNLCVNARDAMPEGGRIMIETSRVQAGSDQDQPLSTLGKGDYALMTIIDTGCGIDKMIRSRIFEPFFTTKEVGKGTGLGLATAYAIVTQHNGRISVESEEGRGAAFRVYLPLMEESRSEVSESRSREPAGGKETVLLAEDDDEVRKLASVILQNAGYSVLPAADGEIAIGLITEHADRIDIAVIDAVMPKKSGKDVLEYYQRMKPGGRVLLVSGYNEGLTDIGVFSETRASFISKPFGSALFLRSIRELLDG